MRRPFSAACRPKTPARRTFSARRQPKSPARGTFRPRGEPNTPARRTFSADRGPKSSAHRPIGVDRGAQSVARRPFGVTTAAQKARTTAQIAARAALLARKAGLLVPHAALLAPDHRRKKAGRKRQTGRRWRLRADAGAFCAVGCGERSAGRGWGEARREFRACVGMSRLRRSYRSSFGSLVAAIPMRMNLSPFSTNAGKERAALFGR